MDGRMDGRISPKGNSLQTSKGNREERNNKNKVQIFIIKFQIKPFPALITTLHKLDKVKML
jgi:hypothetical protein